MLEIGLLHLVELLLVRLVVPESSLVEEVSVICAFFENLECHFEIGILELDEEVHKDLI